MTNSCRYSDITAIKMKYQHILVSALALAMTTMSFGQSPSLSQYKDIDKYVSKTATSKTAGEINFMADSNFYLQLSEDGKKIVKYDTKTGKEIESIFDVSKTRETQLETIEGYILSPDESKILVWTDKEPVYRHSFTARYYVYELRSRLLKPLSTEHESQQAPVFSPDGRMAAFIADNNIFIKKLDYGTEVAVTTDGAINKIINGVPDWCYQEEFDTTSSLAWAPDNLTLCYIKYDETDVPAYSFSLYDSPCDPTPQYALYPGEFNYKYPVAGEQVAKVSVYSYDIETRKTKQITLPGSQIEYIPRIAYAYSPERLIVTTLNRAQTRMEMFSVNPRSTVTKSLIVETADTWLSTATYQKAVMEPDGIVIFSQRSGYSHLYRYSYSGTMTKQLTSGDVDVDAYYGCDDKGNCYFRTAADAINRVICKTDIKGKTTYLSPDKGNASATFSPDKQYYVQNYNSVTQVPVYTIQSSTGKQIRVLEDNSKYAALFAGAPRAEFITVPSAGLELNGYIIKPSDFNPSHKYPVIMYQYSGPDSQEVLNRWSMSWANYFATQGFVIVCVDGRGTGGRGRDFSRIVYKQLGHYESIDQVNAAKYIAQQPWADANRIGIFGWSYGGYEAIMASSQTDAPYAAAVAVAPVTDWRYYDAIYTERFMLTPKENELGYKNASCMTYIANRHSPLLIMSGTADDNVHMANTLQYVAEMQSQGTWCDLLLFPNKNHSINGCNARSLVYARMMDFFRKNL
jgi:hypothetical protein